MNDKVIITVATTGAFPTKEHNKAIPMTPHEIANDVYACWKAGAAIAHLHMRDDDGHGTMSAERFEETISLIRKTDCDIIINCTTSGDLHATDETRMIHLSKVKPEMASYDCGTMNWMNSTVFYNTPAFLEKLGYYMQEQNVKPEIEVFDASFIYNALYYLKKGVLKAPLHFQLCMGAPGGIAATIENLVFLKNLLPKDCTWSAFGIGSNHLSTLFATISMGGHIRVGMEDNVYYAKGELAKSNCQFVERAVRIIQEAGKQPATPNEARKILNIK
ncbi:3-keto-5-aminohexanoate cleavage protein [Gilliamella sp. Pas-s95]|uniref:3-keto-5-aminohexanoate cleavage protein n=1 Tax=Gilliamella sp. Pas-s95 TaxID=2687317 RepID=UPI001322E96A|nr:3-keto-5-aminohexanoate cleavage protein [Gilliamella sp. Pas-s95]MWN04756.1 3-keto-5-aminohexanoate cleavage protein [Gilliamella sp. Pas-s95]